MTYSIIGILAGIILVITNRDVLWLTGNSKSARILRKYRSFLLSVLAYYITDALWGILDAWRLTDLHTENFRENLYFSGPLIFRPDVFESPSPLPKYSLFWKSSLKNRPRSGRYFRSLP